MNYKKLIQYFNQEDFFTREHKIKLLTLQEGYSEVEMQVDPINCNYMGALHGGLLYSLGDIAAGISVMTYGIRCVTLNGSANYLKPVSGGKVIAIGRQVYNGRQIRVCDVKIYDETQELVCTGSFTMYLTGVPVEVS